MYCERCGFTFNEDTKICPRCKNPLPVNKQRMHVTQEDGAIDKWRELDTVPIEEDDDNNKFSNMLTTGNKHAIAAVAIRLVFYIISGIIALILGKQVLNSLPMMFVNWILFIIASAVAIFYESEEEEQLLAKILGAIIVVDGLLLLIRTGILIIAFVSLIFK